MKSEKKLMGFRRVAVPASPVFPTSGARSSLPASVEPATTHVSRPAHPRVLLLHGPAVGTLKTTKVAVELSHHEPNQAPVGQL